MIFFTGFARNASDIAKEQIKVTLRKKRELDGIYDICLEGFSVLNDERESIDRVGKLLNDQWLIKRSLTDKITNKNIDDIYNAGIEAGALGGKLLGAGAGGFILFYVPKEKKEAVKNSLKTKNYVYDNLLLLISKFRSFVKNNPYYEQELYL